MDKISISRFSLMTRLTQKALRLYDAKGLLIPQEKNDITGYRYYTIAQIETGLKIKSLTLLGFTIEDIKRYLQAETNQDTTQIHALLQKRLHEIRTEQRNLAHIASFLQEKNHEVLTMIKKEPTIKEIPEMRVISIREKGRFETTTGALIQRLCTTLMQEENKKKVTVTGPVMSLCYDEEYKEEDVDIECAIPITGQIIINDEKIKLQTYPACTVLSYQHIGPYEQLYETYVSLYKHIEEHGWKALIPNRELYLNDPAEVPEESIQTEIQIPIQK